MWSQIIKPKKKWSEDKTMNFVREYRNNDCLWDVNHKDYKNRRVREVVCCKMAEKFNCTPDDIRRKIKSLRGAYCHERNKIEDSIESTFDVDNVYVPSVIWYDEMDAVMNGGGNEAESAAVSQPENIEHTDNDRPSGGDDDAEQLDKKDDCSSTNDNSDDEPVSENSHLEQPLKANERALKLFNKSSRSESVLHKVSNSSNIIRKKKKDESHRLFTAIDKLHSITSKSNEQFVEENEFDLFGKCVAQQLKNFKDIKIALRLQQKIQGLISEERIREINNTQDIVASSKVQQPTSSNRSISESEPISSSDKNTTSIGLSGLMTNIELDNVKFI